MASGTYPAKINQCKYVSMLRYVSSGNLVGNSLVGTCLTLPNLGFLWVFFKHPKISKNGNPLFFPVIKNCRTVCH